MTNTNQPVTGRQRRKLDARRSAQRRRILFLGGATGLAVIVVIGLIVLNRDTNGNKSTVAAAPNAIDASIPRDGAVLGDPEAPVTMDVWGDFQCPACKRFSESVLPSVIADYVASGKVRVVYHDFPFIDRAIMINAAGTPITTRNGESVRAAEAASCAADQNKYWEFHEALFANQEGENVGSFTVERLTEIAKTVELDQPKFSTCLTDGTHHERVLESLLTGSLLGIDSTPTIFVNGVKVQSNNYPEVKKAIEAELAG